MKTPAKPRVPPPDPVAEMRRIRDDLAAEHHYDIHALCDAARRRQKASGRKVVDRSRSLKPLGR
jgi:hypothetical protein